MRPSAKISLQAICAATAGSSFCYFFGMNVPTRTAAEMIHALGNISVIAGSLVGWSVGWIAQSRGLIRDVDYDSAREIFDQLGELQIEIIRRWLIVFVCSVFVIAFAVIMKMPQLNSELYRCILILSSGLLGIALVFILYFFQRMIALSHLKSKLEELERDQLRKKRLLPES